MQENAAEYVIALDVGGTSVKSAVIAQGGRMLGKLQVALLESGGRAETILDALAAIIRQHTIARAPARGRGIGIGFPGPFDYQSGICYIEGLDKFSALYGRNVRIELQTRLGSALPIRFRNDAEAAVVGEAHFGVGQPYRRVIGMTLGTGCGSAFLVDGVPVVSGQGVPAQGWLYPCAFRGRRADDLFSTRGLMARVHTKGLHFSDPEAAAHAAREGAAAARQIWDEFGVNLGAFLEPFAKEFEAEAILILGGLSGAFDLFGPALKSALPMPVLRGRLGAAAALLGAAQLFF